MIFLILVIQLWSLLYLFSISFNLSNQLINFIINIWWWLLTLIMLRPKILNFFGLGPSLNFFFFPLPLFFSLEPMFLFFLFFLFLFFFFPSFSCFACHWSTTTNVNQTLMCRDQCRKKLPTAEACHLSCHHEGELLAMNSTPHLRHLSLICCNRHR